MLTLSTLTTRPGGFTLIELMVSLAVVAMAFALGVPAFGTWMQNTQIRTVAESIQNGLHVARNEALRRNCLVQFNMNNDTSWTVTAMPPSGNEIVQERVKDEGSSASIQVIFYPIGSNSTATFDGLGRRVDPPVQFEEIDVVSTVSGTKVLRMQIKGGGGQIRMCDPLVAPMDIYNSRRCQ